MILNDDLIIRNALLKLGEVGTYNDNRSGIYKNAKIILNEVVLPSCAMDTDFSFNSVTVTLNKSGSTTPLGEYRYNMPADFISLCQYYPEKSARVENENICSFETELSIRYCRRITLAEYPLYMQNYLISTLAHRLSQTYSTYNAKLDELNLEQKRLEGAIKTSEGFVSVNETREVNPYSFGLDY